MTVIMSDNQSSDILYSDDDDFNAMTPLQVRENVLSVMSEWILLSSPMLTMLTPVKIVAVMPVLLCGQKAPLARPFVPSGCLNGKKRREVGL